MEDKYNTSTQLNKEALGKDEKDQYYDPKRVLDEIHGYIEISSRIKDIIDTPHFQRLRGLKQLGATYHVFPGGSHNRFEHSLGVMHLSGKVIRHIQTTQPNMCKSLGINDETEFCIRAAGLLHDLGHGPFSHVFDHQFMPDVMSNDCKDNDNNNGKKSNDDNKENEENEENGDNDSSLQEDIDIEVNNSGNKPKSIKKFKFRHEDMSVKLIDDLFKSNNIDISDKSLELIKALVSPSTHMDIYEEYAKNKKAFLFQIIANEQSGIDVDKWDYMLRDSRNCNLGVTFDYSRLLEHCRVIDGNICYHDKTAYELYLLFRTRYELFRRVYSHKTSKAIEYMICDILKYANPIFKITEATQDVKKYLKLKDCIIDQIEYFDERNEFIKKQYSENDIASIIKAKKLIERWHTRKLYRNVGYCLLEPRQVDAVWRQLLSNPNELETIAEVSKESSKEASNGIGGGANDKESSNYITPVTTPKKFGNTTHNESFFHKKLPFHQIEIDFRNEIYKYFCQTIGQRDKNSKDNDNENDNGIRIPGKDILIVQLMSLSYGMEDKHPIEQVYLFNSEDPSSSRRVSANQISYMDTIQSSEIIFRCFVKDEIYKEFGSQAFHTFLKKHKLIDDDSLSTKTNSLRVSPQSGKAALKRRQTDCVASVSPPNNHNDNNNNKNNKSFHGINNDGDDDDDDDADEPMVTNLFSQKENNNNNNKNDSGDSGGSGESSSQAQNQSVLGKRKYSSAEHPLETPDRHRARH